MRTPGFYPGFFCDMNYLFQLYKQSFSNIQRPVWIVAIAMFINRSGSMVLLFASLYLTNDLHFSIAQAGFSLGFYGAGSVAGSYVGGWLTDRRSYYDVMLFSLIISGIILLFLLLVKTPMAVSIVIFLYAFAADTFRPANSKAIAVYSEKENRTRSVSLVRLAINLGFAIGPAVGGFVAITLGYHALFIIDSATSFAAAAMLFVYLPRKDERPATAASQSFPDRKTISAYRDKAYLFFILFVALYGICFFQLFASVPQFYSKQWQYSEDTIGLLMGLNGLLVVVIEMPLVSNLEKIKRNFPFIIAGVLFIPLAFLGLLLGNGLPLFAIMYTILITFSEIFAMPFMMNHALSRPEKDRQGQYAALYSIAFGIANIVAPFVGLAVAARYGFHTLFYGVMGISLVTVIGFFILSKKEQRS